MITLIVSVFHRCVRAHFHPVQGKIYKRLASSSSLTQRWSAQTGQINTQRSNYASEGRCEQAGCAVTPRWQKKKSSVQQTQSTELYYAEQNRFAEKKGVEWSFKMKGFTDWGDSWWQIVNRMIGHVIHTEAHPPAACVRPSVCICVSGCVCVCLYKHV